MAKTDMVDKSKVYAIWRKASGWSDLAFEVEPYDDGGKGIQYSVSALRGHRIKGKLGKKTKRGFTFISENPVFPGKWEFVEVTYEGMKAGDYGNITGREKILEQVSNTQELQEWYNRHWKTWW